MGFIIWLSCPKDGGEDEGEIWSREGVEELDDGGELDLSLRYDNEIAGIKFFWNID